MKKKVFIAMALLTAVAAGSTPMTSYAAEGKAGQLQRGGCYSVYAGQGLSSLRQTLKELGITGGNAGNGCLDTSTPDMGDTGTQAPGNTDASAPETPVYPDVELPDVQEPEEDGADEAALSYAQQVVKLVNEERAKAGLPALTVQTDITKAANVRAKEIRQQFSHTRPDGSSFSTALKEQGVSYRGSGENIAYGQKTPAQVMEGWMNSSGHRANILNANYKNIGVGYYQDERGVNHWVQLFTY